MGVLLSRNCNQPNPLSGLTKQDIKTIKRTWAPVFKRADDYGMELFKRFFRADPDTKTLFIMIKNLDETQYKDNPQFKAHVYGFMTSFNMAINKLQDPEMVVSMMTRLGEAHKRRKVPQRHFDTLKDVFVNFLVNDLKLDDQALGSWTRFVGFIYPVIFEALN